MSHTRRSKKQTEGLVFQKGSSGDDYDVTKAKRTTLARGKNIFFHLLSSVFAPTGATVLSHI
jgi:hypothetical protein